MNTALVLVGLAFLITVVVVAITNHAEKKASGSWYGWYEHTDPYWETATTASHSTEPVSVAGDDTC